MRVDPNYSAQLADSLNSSSATEQRLTGELSSGLRVASLSDDPVAVAANVGLSSALSRADTFVQTASREQGLLQSTDSALGEVVTQVTSAISLATQAGNGTLNADNLNAITRQVTDLRSSVVGLANSSYSGQYLFGGSQGGTAPFTLDTSTDPAVATYHGDAVTQSIQTPTGQAIAVNVSGAAVFQASGGDLLATLNQLVSDLGKGDTTAISADTASLSAALGQVSTQRAQLGGSLAALTSASGYASTQATELAAQQTTLLSANTAEVATDLQTSETQHQALLNVIAGLGKTDLFDYLK